MKKISNAIWIITFLLIAGLVGYVAWKEHDHFHRYEKCPINRIQPGSAGIFVSDVRLGWCERDGKVIEENYFSSSSPVTVYIQNLDSWLLSSARSEPRMLPQGLNDGALTKYADLTKLKAEASKPPPSGTDSTKVTKWTDAQAAELETLQGTIYRWLNEERRNLRLDIAGHTFPSMEPFDVTPANEPGTQAKNPETRAVFSLTPPDDAAEVAKWRAVIRAVGANCSAQISVSILLDNNQGAVRMPTLVNGDALNSEGARPVRRELPLVPGIRRGAAAVAVLVSLAMVLAAAFGTRALRDGRDFTLAKKNVHAPWSLSRVVFAWWLAICVACFAYIWAVTGEHANTLSSTVPLLLGISGATLLVTAGFGRRTTPPTDSAPAAVDVPPLPSQGFFGDLLSEAGEPEVSRLQMLVWNVVLGVVFVWQTVFKWEMPVFDATIMTLLGISSTTYAGFKFLPGSGAPRPPEEPSSSSSSSTSSSSAPSLPAPTGSSSSSLSAPTAPPPPGSSSSSSGSASSSSS